MAKTNRVQRQLIINITLMLFTLLTLVACVAAWFSTRTEANINNLNLAVDRKDIVVAEFTDNIIFPYATKFLDTDADTFNKESLQVKTYTVLGEGQLYVDVRCAGQGMLAYVPDDTVTDYHTALINDLKNHFKTTNLNDKSFEDISTALSVINKKRIGTTNAENNTELKIVYWVEYDQVKNRLKSADYWLDTNYKAVIEITA